MTSVTLIGRIAGDTYIRKNEEWGRLSLKFSVASESILRPIGGVKRRPDWITCYVTEEALVQYAKNQLHKGRLVLITGRLITRYRNVNEQRVQVTAVMVESIQFVHAYTGGGDYGYMYMAPEGTPIFFEDEEWDTVKE